MGVIGSNDLALPFLEGKQKGAVGSDFYLGFVAGAVQFLATLEKKFVQFVTVDQGIAKKWRGETMEALIEGVEKNEAMIGKNAGEERGEGAAIRGYGSVGLVEEIAEGLTEEGLRAYDQFVNFLAEMDAANGNVLVSRFGERE